MRKLLSLPVTKEKEEGAMTMAMKMKMKKGPWTAEEDELLSNCIKRDGEGRWRTLPKRAGLQRCGKSCRLRWINYLRPSVKRGHFSSDEDDLILRLHRLLGNRWSLIAGRIPGRTDNDIKNYWNTHLSKKLLRQGIDPRTHKPLLSDHSHPPPTTTTTTAATAASFPLLNQILDDEVIANTNTNTNTSNDAFILSTNNPHHLSLPNHLIHHQYTTTLYPQQVVPPPPPPPSSHSPTFNHCPNPFTYYDPQNQNQVDNDDDDVFSSFLNSLLNDDIHIFPSSAHPSPSN